MIADEDELDEAAVNASLTTRWVGRPYLYRAQLDSTNDRLKRMLVEDNPAEGTVVLTDYQTAGRGRLDRRWEAPPRTSLLFSVLFRPGWPAREGGRLTMLAGLAAAEAVEAVTGLPARLKWPNDLVLEQDGAWRKFGGLLLDSSLDADGRLTSAILGIGININITTADLPEAATPATSLLAVTGRPTPRRPLLVGLLAGLEQHYDAAAAGHSPRAAWEQRLVTLGRTVSVTTSTVDEPLVGMAEGTDEWGQLLVRDASGRMHTISAGDVTLRGR